MQVCVANPEPALEPVSFLQEMDFEMEEGPASFLRRWLAASGWNNDPREVFSPIAWPVTIEDRLWCWRRANRNDPRRVFAEHARRRCAEILRFQLTDGRWLELHILSSSCWGGHVVVWCGSMRLALGICPSGLSSIQHVLRSTQCADGY